MVHERASASSLVDEFQDTDPLQTEMLMLLAEPRTAQQ
jgi:ATP-dependent exoDNAse (exonuclease V) beta subunit